MASIYKRGKRLYARVRDDQGSWMSERTAFFVGQQKAALAWAADLEAAFDRERQLREAGVSSPLLVRVRDYVPPWIAERKRRGIASYDDDETRLRLHVLPRIGDMLIADVRRVHIRDIVRDLMATDMAPRTIRNVYAVTHTLFGDAQVEERIAANPCTLKRGELPGKIDKHADWRHKATFAIAEVAKLVTDPRVPRARRMLYAIKALTGMRHGEVARLKWDHYDPDVLPLGRLTVAVTKTKITRLVPVHPVLAQQLRAWRARWEDEFGRAPTAADLIVPFAGERGLRAWPVQRALERFHEDLGALALRIKAGEHRNRGGHDLRAWFITTAQEHGAHRDLLRVVTHPGKGDIVSGYTRAPWASICAEVAKLRLVLDGAPEVLATSLATSAATADNHSQNEGRMTGIENVSRGDAARGDSPSTRDAEAAANQDEHDRTRTVAGLATALAAAVLTGDHPRARELAERIQGLAAPRLVRVA